MSRGGASGIGGQQVVDDECAKVVQVVAHGDRRVPLVFVEVDQPLAGSVLGQLSHHHAGLAQGLLAVLAGEVDGGRELSRFAGLEQLGRRAPRHDDSGKRQHQVTAASAMVPIATQVSDPIVPSNASTVCIISVPRRITARSAGES
jgi:hypothetical protein